MNELTILGAASKFDTCGLPKTLEKSLRRSTRVPIEESVIYPSVFSSGRRVNLFKILQSNICQKSCLYCANRCERNLFRLKFPPEKLANEFMRYYQRGYVEGLFLSSGIEKSANYATSQMLKTVSILRYGYNYGGYIHFVILPGTTTDLIEEAARVSDRLSINLEAPSPKRLARISPSKDFNGEILRPLRDIASIDTKKPLKAGITSQFVVGAADESDAEILNAARELYLRYRLWRSFYSGFEPIKDTPLEQKRPCSSLRTLRLYQSDFLLRKYNFKFEELPFDKGGNLPLGLDPKLAWARTHPENFPMEINRAEYEQLIRVPGIGRVSAKRILKARRQGRIRNLEQLKKLGISLRRCRNFVTIEGRFFPLKEPAPTNDDPKQLFFWEEL